MSITLSAGVGNTRNKILDYLALKNFHLKCVGAPAIIVRYSNAHCYTLSAKKWTETVAVNESTLAQKHLKRWAERTDSLWWSSLTLPIVGKRTVRSHSARKVRLALVESLRRVGYASDGSRLPGTEERMPLYGTLQLGALPAILKTKTDRLIQQTDLVVAHMLRMQLGGRTTNFGGSNNTGGGTWKQPWKQRGPKQETQLNRPSFRTVRL